MPFVSAFFWDWVGWWAGFAGLCIRECMSVCVRVCVRECMSKMAHNDVVVAQPRADVGKERRRPGLSGGSTL